MQDSDHRPLLLAGPSLGLRLAMLACAAVLLMVADQPLDNFLPLYKAANDDSVVTQFDGPTVEKVGLLKMDSWTSSSFLLRIMQM